VPDTRLVLVVEDEPHIRDLVALHLGLEGWTADVVGDGLEGLERLRQNSYDLVILDIMLPGLDGLTLLTALRRESRNTDVPVMARARALMRRPRATADRAVGGKPAVVRDLEVDPARRRATVGGREVELTSHEFDLLYLLASHPGVVFSREALLARIWKGDTFVTDRSVDALVKRVRKKIEPDQSAPTHLLTVWGTGYKCVDE